MNAVEIQVAMQGHDRMAGRWEKQARRDGKGSEAHRRYMHHVNEWLRLNDLKRISEDLRQQGAIYDVCARVFRQAFANDIVVALYLETLSVQVDGHGIDPSEIEFDSLEEAAAHFMDVCRQYRAYS